MTDPRFGASSACILLLAGAAAAASTVHEVRGGSDTVSGGVSDAAEGGRMPIRLVEGSTLGVSVRAARKSGLLPVLALLGIDRRPDAGAAAAIRSSRRGDSAALKDFAVARTGLHYVEVRSDRGTTGGWTLRTKVKSPRGAAGTAVAPSPGLPAAFEFIAPGNATAILKAAAPKGSAAVPAFAGLLDPAGSPVPVEDLAAGKSGFTAREVLLAAPGKYTLLLEPVAGATESATVKVRWKVPRPVRRALLHEQVITDPVPTAVTPASGDTSDRFPVSVAVDFALPGARVLFRREPTVVTIPGTSVTVDAETVAFLLNLSSFQKGLYDVEVENPDGGKGILEDAFRVSNAPARPVAVDPSFGYDNQVVTVTITGSFLMSGAAYALERGGDAIPGTGLVGAGSQAQVRFDLRDRAIGAWDLVVANPDAAPARLPGVFEIRNSPPFVASISPASNASSAVVSCVIAGTDFDAVPGAGLRMAGQADITGTPVTWISGGEIRAVFDTGGAALGVWDVVVTNPDGTTGTLPGPFRIRGTVGPAAMVLAPVNSADGPPAVAYGAARDEFLVGWVDVDGANSDVFVQRVSATGTPLGSRVAASSSAGSVPKKDVAVAWDPYDDQFPVAWSEIRPLAVGSGHPSYPYSSTGVYEVLAQRLRASDLAAQGGNVQVTDHTYHSGFYIDEFNNLRSSVAWDSSQRLWRIIWMQEWDTSGRYSLDDYDVFFRSLDPANAGSPLGPLGWGAMTAYHEGDPSAAWDPVGGQVLFAYNTRPGASSRLEVRLGAGASSAVVASDSAADLVDPQIAGDPVSKRVLLSWTRRPSGGNRTVEAAVFDGTNLAARIGKVLTVGAGSGEEHFLARPLFCAALGEGLLAWTRVDGSGNVSVRYRHLATGAAGGLAASGPESEASGAGGDEGTPVVVPSAKAGECALFWLKTLTLSNAGSYTGSVVNGTYRGKEIWIRRYR